jgi:hypothetical protein
MTNTKAILKEAVNLIKGWHNLAQDDALTEKKKKGLWNLYYNHAPQIKRIREAIEK